MPKEKKTILFVEDDKDHQKLYSLVFRRAGYKFIQVTEGKKALEIAKKEKPDLILLDILMNDINGIEVLKQFKKDKELAEIPVIIVTNYNQEDTLKEAIALGALDIIFKTDVIPRQVVDLVENTYLSE